MSAREVGSGRTASVVVGCTDPAAEAAFFVEELGFRLESILPADDPAVAVVAGFGVRLRLVRAAPDARPEHGGPPRLRLEGPFEEASTSVAPGGTRVELVPSEDAVVVPPAPARPALVVSRAGDDGAWRVGRAGMLYRDLIPGRLGGRFIASHIRIPDGGEVPDYVHFHRVRFQAIACVRGWVRVVYEDQGPPFVLREGDCVLQPPEIRHRVLECSPGLEVVEVGCPAEHETRVENALELPTDTPRPDRDFRGQRFARHEAARAAWGPWRDAGFECRDSGIARATGGLGSVRTARVARPPSAERGVHDGELLFLFALSGGLRLHAGALEPLDLARGDAVAVPPGVPFGFEGSATGAELLEVALPAPT